MSDTVYITWISVVNQKENNNNKKDICINAGLLIMNKPKILWDFYFEMSIL